MIQRLNERRDRRSSPIPRSSLSAPYLVLLPPRLSIGVPLGFPEGFDCGFLPSYVGATFVGATGVVLGGVGVNAVGVPVGRGVGVGFGVALELGVGAVDVGASGATSRG